MAILYVDECGFTGSDLLSVDQPFFVVATLHLEDEQVDAWHAPLAAATGAAEPCYSALAKTGRGRRALLGIARTLDANQQRIRFQLVHKRYALLGKLLDCVVEPMYDAAGRSFYADGFNLALLNLLHWGGQLHAPDELSAVLSKWLALCRAPTPEAVDTAERAILAMSKRHPSLGAACSPVLRAFKWRRRAGWDDIDKEHLQLQTASLVNLVWQWNQEVPGALTVHADESKELRAALDALAAAADPAGPAVELRGSGRTVGFPLRLGELRLCDSASSRGIQVADVAAGLVTHSAVALTEPGRRVPGYSESLVGLVGEWPRMNQIVPEAKFTPEALGRKGFDCCAFLDVAQARLSMSDGTPPHR